MCTKTYVCISKLKKVIPFFIFKQKTGDGDGNNDDDDDAFSFFIDLSTNLWTDNMPPLVGNSLKSEDKKSLSSSESYNGAHAAPSRSPSVSMRARQLGIDAVECTHPRNLCSLPLPIIDVLLRDDITIAMRKIVKKLY